MFDKRGILIKFGSIAMVFALVVMSRPLSSFLWIGEPKLPAKFQK